MTTMDDTGFGPTDFRKYHHAIVLAMEGSFIRASDRLCITQSALTRSIQTLEKELGIPLFDRRRNRISMTPAGKQILERAQAVLSQAKNMARDVELIRGGKLGNVSLGATPIAGAILLPAVLAEAYARHPHLGVTIESNSSLELITKLLEEKIEFFIGYSSQFSNRTDISIQPLIRIPVDFFVRAGHPLLSVDDIDAKALSAYPWCRPISASTGARVRASPDSTDPERITSIPPGSFATRFTCRKHWPWGAMPYC